MKKGLLFFLFLFVIRVNIAYSQTSYNFSQEVQFAEYLTKNRAYSDAIFLLHQLNTKEYSKPQSDSIHYLLGRNYYLTDRMDSSGYYYSKVRITSAFYHPSKFLEAYTYINTNQFNKAEDLLNSILRLDTFQAELKTFELAGISLLQRDYQKFDSLFNSFSYRHSEYAVEQRNFFAYKEDYLKIKNKSPLVAGVLSAIVPGSGKYYTGYKRQAFATFLAVAAIGAVTAETYIKGGARNIPFIASAGVFTIFYTGNIWGSILSVKIKRNERYREIDHLVMSDLHKPLQRIYKQ